MHAEQIHFPFYPAEQNGMWVKKWLSHVCAATSQTKEGFVALRRAIAAVEKCQFDALFQGFLFSATVVVG